MKKLLVGLTTAALVASVAAPVLAQPLPNGDGGDYQMNCGNGGMTCNVQMVKANTGMNGIANSEAMGDDSKTEDNNENFILTGEALAEAKARTVMNSNLKEGCCEDGAPQDNYMNSADVKNLQGVKANTGMNGIANSKSCGDDSESDSNDGNGIGTGMALAEAKAMTIANSNIQRDCCGVQYNEMNEASVINAQMVKANTGMNHIGDSKAEGGESDSHDNDGNVIETGHAWGSASTFTLVNSNVERGWMEGPVNVE